jgi:hypothetical protein
MTTLCSVERVCGLIGSGRPLLIAGHADLLRQLPRGAWLGGTIPYFMTEEGGVENETELLVTELPATCSLERLKVYDREHLGELPGDYPENGLSFIVLPAASQTLSQFARQGPELPGFFDRPLVGWVSGLALDELHTRKPLVFDGTTGQAHEDAAVVMHLRLERGWCAKADIINLFRAGDGDRITFPSSGFSAGACLVNGAPTQLVDYLLSKGIDQRLPLVADYSGAAINVSIQTVDEASGRVSFFAPVFEGVEYRFAAPTGPYQEAFKNELASRRGEPLFTCNCVLNYLYAQLHGEKTPGAEGPFTFGEIAWMLLNQTVVYVTLERTNR